MLRCYRSRAEGGLLRPSDHGWVPALDLRLVDFGKAKRVHSCQVDPSEQRYIGPIEGILEAHGEATRPVGNWWESRSPGRWGTDCEGPSIPSLAFSGDSRDHCSSLN